VRRPALRRLVLGLAIPLLAATSSACASSSPARVDVHIGAVLVHAEVATTPAAQIKGLGGRESMADDAGMLFVFPNARQATFWMKDMRFPLDFVWISADKHVEEVTQSVPAPAPGTADADLTLYKPAGAVQYVVELNAGAVEASGIRVGDAVTFQPEVPLESAQ
jgi:uncharacterized membrane protein (UPF0127 family)